MELQKLIDWCAEQINDNNIDGGDCPDLDDCQIELQIFERLAVEDVIRVRKGEK